MKCLICSKDAELLVNDEPLCKIHFIFGINYNKVPLKVTTEPIEIINSNEN